MGVAGGLLQVAVDGRVELGHLVGLALQCSKKGEEGEYRSRMSVMLLLGAVQHVLDWQYWAETMQADPMQGLTSFSSRKRMMVLVRGGRAGLGEKTPAAGRCRRPVARFMVLRAMFAVEKT